jgi:uncharacterized protein YndB with AHSA1/START domain
LDCAVTDDSLHLRIRIDAPADTVFKALTDADTLTDWLAESAEVSLDDYRYEFWGRYAPQGDRPRQQLLAAAPPTSLRFTWTFDSANADPAPSTVDLTMTPDDDGGTMLAVAHTGLPIDGTADITALSCFWHVSLANLAAQCEGLPTMPPFDFSVPAQGDALVRTVIDVGVDEVFACLLDPTQVDKWANANDSASVTKRPATSPDSEPQGGTADRTKGGAKAVIEASVGGRYDFGWGDHGPLQVLELEPDKVLAYSWRHRTGPDTEVRFALRSSRGSTYLTLMHSGFDNDLLAEEFRQNWPGYLVEIKRILELGDRWEPLKV